MQRFVTFEADHHRLQRAPRPPIDRNNLAGPGGGKVHPGIALVREHGLTDFDAVSLAHVHARANTDDIGAHDGD